MGQPKNAGYYDTIDAPVTRIGPNFNRQSNGSLRAMANANIRPDVSAEEYNSY